MKNAKNTIPEKQKIQKSKINHHYPPRTPDFDVKPIGIGNFDYSQLQISIDKHQTSNQALKHLFKLIFTQKTNLFFVKTLSWQSWNNPKKNKTTLLSLISQLKNLSIRFTHSLKQTNSEILQTSNDILQNNKKKSKNKNKKNETQPQTSSIPSLLKKLTSK